MGSARRCLAAAARQLKVNMKKIQINMPYNWKPLALRGKRRGKDIECSYFIPDLLPLFAFVGLFTLPCLLPKVISFFTHSAWLLFRQIQFRRRKASSSVSV